MTEKIFDDLERGWDAFTERIHHGHYHDPEAAATPATEAPMSVISTFEADAEQALATVQSLIREKLPTALADTKKLADNPVVDALLAAVHVPAEALTMAVSVINQLEDLYKPETDSPAPAEVAAPADPVMGQPVAVPAQ